MLRSPYCDAIILGGAQLGLRYGITGGRFLSREVFFELLDKAYHLGYRSWDMAQAYGCAEVRAAFWRCSRNYPDMAFGSKIQLPQTDPEALRAAQQRLRRSRRYLAPHSGLAYVLLHSHGAENPTAQLRALQGLCRDNHHLRPHINNRPNNRPGEKIGLSLYYPRELEALFRSQERGDCPSIDVLQIPYNFADRRFEPYFGQLSRMGIELQLRSIYLQGLLFSGPTDLEHFNSGFFRPLKPLLQALAEPEAQGLQRQDVLLYFALQQAEHFAPGKLRLVLGVSGGTELLQLHHSLQRIASWPEDLRREIKQQQQIKDPALWPEENILVPALWPSIRQN
ncbi:hypothetical protein P0082_08445 [Candidatus Haliotispira prima]|uniref:NADP-dependent oxidoreductase domain-containing protein n=1 Tax=Candidatus Haliotispira prima TaxID=3034016 RepID=A0ABY8MF04_9SPIO|nr:hypothetical protein P0082_08445 [Candidatus Haliotispira prima]